MSKLKLSIFSGFLLLGVIPEVLRLGAIASPIGSNNSSSSGATYLAQAKPPAPRSNKTVTEEGWAIPKDVRKTVVTPSGDVVEPGGIVTFREGFKAQVIYGQDRKPVGYQLFKLDGTKLKPGERLRFPGGATLVQPRF